MFDIIRIGQHRLAQCQHNVPEWDIVMVLMVWFPSGATLLSRHECALSQIGAHPDMMVDVARM